MIDPRDARIAGSQKLDLNGFEEDRGAESDRNGGGMMSRSHESLHSAALEG